MTSRAWSLAVALVSSVFLCTSLSCALPATEDGDDMRTARGAVGGGQSGGGWITWGQQTSVSTNGLVSFIAGTAQAVPNPQLLHVHFERPTTWNVTVSLFVSSAIAGDTAQVSGRIIVGVGQVKLVVPYVVNTSAVSNPTGQTGAGFAEGHVTFQLPAQEINTTIDFLTIVPVDANTRATTVTFLAAPVVD